VLSIGTVLVDFDGTACLHDVAEHLLMEFGDPSWEELDRAWALGKLGAREVLSRQSAMLERPTDELLRYALGHCPIDPTFPPFVDWCRQQSVEVTLVSDGFGFYIAPLLDAVGLNDVAVVTNTWRGDPDGALGFEAGHGSCRWCGTCKVEAVARARASHGPVAFVGEGGSDRLGAKYADLVFAKDRLPEYLDEDGVPYNEWVSFDDVRHALENGATVRRHAAPDRCPNWKD
jgi:2-hydroxy-3-keto-5-methylthiopentenyl-1-phosphate phosphatase